MSRIARAWPWAIVAAAAWTAVAPAWAQANLDAGKSAAQIFADTCNACHRGPREIRPTSAAFLREHYTTGPGAAAAMAAYLASVGSDARAVQQRRPPTLGARQAPSPGADQAKPADDQAAAPANGRSAVARPRRPSESIEAGNLPIAPPPENGAEASPPRAAATAPSRQPPGEVFEE